MHDLARNPARSKPSRGPLVAIGGHEDKDGECVILREIARRLDRGLLVVATVASEDPGPLFNEYRRVFSRLGVHEIDELYVRDRGEAYDEDKSRALDRAAGIFLTGGDQLRISSQIGDTPLFSRIHAIHERGGVVAGTSAGAAVMSGTMLIGGSNSESHRIGDLSMAPGLGLIGDVMIDSHFAEHGRIGRLLGAVSHNPRVLGVGIDEDTAVVVEGGRFQVFGSGGVYVIDAAGVTHSNIAEAEPQRTLSVHDVRMHVLGSGDVFDISGRRPVLETKDDVSGRRTVQKDKERTPA
ncbi:cyanophycinase [Arenibaculum pallidiluteum]|uniref:cyanophycinase n=1 Tax=Arenibaculum pallidiluteum TaxID=2812559 RepID=UPI001A967FD8|nr:cyanophycinase [Arenibaculum pallidiluteum]